MSSSPQWHGNPPMGETPGGVLFVHAHPDDECVATGGTIARLVAEGVPVHLVTCTDGAEGEIHDPDLDQEEARPRLAAIRARELACSLEALGGGAIRHHMLGYRDSGMIGTEANEHPESFWQADIGAAVARLMPVVRAARPSVIVSYDENGNYGHPDHINAARIAREAYLAAGDASAHPDAGAPWRVSRFYEVAFSREGWMGLVAEMKERGISLPWGLDEGEEPPAVEATSDDLSPASAASVAGVAAEVEEGTRAEEVEWGRPEAEITTRVEVTAHLAAKQRSMECHRTQRQDMGWMLELPDDLRERVMGMESYHLRWLDGGAPPDDLREEWLLEPARMRRA